MEIILKPIITITPFNATVCYDINEDKGCLYCDECEYCMLFQEYLESTPYPDDDTPEDAPEGELRCAACLASETLTVETLVNETLDEAKNNG
jgi:hypothetical protein